MDLEGVFVSNQNLLFRDTLHLSILVVNGAGWGSARWLRRIISNATFILGSSYHLSMRRWLRAAGTQWGPSATSAATAAVRGVWSQLRCFWPFTEL